MKKLTISLLLFVALCSSALAQTYWSMCDSNMPPSPFNWCPDCDTYDQGDGNILVDDCVLTWNPHGGFTLNVPDPGDGGDTNSYGPTNGFWMYVVGTNCPGNNYTGGTNHPANTAPIQWANSGTDGMLHSWDDWLSWREVTSDTAITVWWHDACTNHPGSWPAFTLVSVYAQSNVWATNSTVVYMTNGYKAVRITPRLVDTNNACCTCISNSASGGVPCDPTNLTCCPPGFTNIIFCTTTNVADTNCIPPPLPWLYGGTNIWGLGGELDEARYFPAWAPYRNTGWMPLYPMWGESHDVPPVINFEPKVTGGRGQPGSNWYLEGSTNLNYWVRASTNFTFSAEGTNAIRWDFSNVVYYLGLPNIAGSTNLAAEYGLTNFFIRLRQVQ